MGLFHKIVLNDEDEQREQKKGCTICGLAKALHFYKSHPYSPQRVKATYNLDSLGINTDAIVGLDEISFTERIQAEGREMWKTGSLIEEIQSDGVVQRVHIKYRPHDEDYRHDVDCGELRASNHPPGRAIIELFAGRGLVGDNPDPTRRIYIAQNEDWPSVFAHVIALSREARKREPLLRVGQRVIVERSMAERIRVYTPSGGNQPALFQVLHVDDIYAIT